MSTFADLISDVKQACRETTTEKDAFLLNAAAREYRNLLRADSWPQARVTGQSISIVSGTQNYDLPTDFDRFSGDRVNYFQGLSPAWNAISLPILMRGSQMGDTRVSGWEAIATTQNIRYPEAVGIQSGGTNTYQLVLYPLSGITGDTITFDYYAVPQRNEISMATTITVDQLYETLMELVAAQFWMYELDDDKTGLRMKTAITAHRNARMSLNRL